MALTASDLEQAISDLVMGKRVVSMSIAGKQMEFGHADLPELRSLHAEKVEEEAAATPTPSYMLTRTSKGL